MLGRATSANAVSVLKDTIARKGMPAAVMTDRGVQSCANDAATHRRRGATEFERLLVARGIGHVLAGVGHPQTNGKVERLFGELKRKNRMFRNIEEFVRWRDCIKPHRSLDWESLETPARAFRRKMADPCAGIVTDSATGERYRVLPPGPVEVER